MNPLCKDALLKILTEPKNSITKQYIELFKYDNIDLVFKKDALEFMVEKAINYNLGARGLRTICESIMIDAMFDIQNIKDKLVIDEKYAKKHLHLNE